MTTNVKLIPNHFNTFFTSFATKMKRCNYWWNYLPFPNNSAGIESLVNWKSNEYPINFIKKYIAIVIWGKNRTILTIFFLFLQHSSLQLPSLDIVKVSNRLIYLSRKSLLKMSHFYPLEMGHHKISNII